MLDIKKIKGIIFDYGGTIDSNGKHWAEVIWDAYQQTNIPVSKEQFREAYIYAERYLAVNPVIEPNDHFGILLKKKADLQIAYLVDKNYLSDKTKTSEFSLAVSAQCYNFAKKIIDKEKSLLSELKNHYPMVLVSNFYGNVQAVLADFELLHLFDDIIESAVVGVRKPDPAIFAIGVDKLSLPASQIVVIGDSYKKDIVPATVVGCHTIWLKGLGWEADDENASADAIIKDFMELRSIFHL